MDDNCKCSQENGLCWPMSERCKNAGDTGYGFFTIQCVDLSSKAKQASIVLRGIRYKMTPKDPGLALNVCPFCGERIDWFRK
jgi:hypothetical protein